MKLKQLAALTAALTMATGAIAAGQTTEQLYGSFSYVDDGGCDTVIPTMELGYSRSSENLRVGASVRTAASGGNCEVESVSYNLEVSKDFPLGWKGCGANAKFVADKRSASAPYALASGTVDPVVIKSIKTRDDGKPEHVTRFPAGAAETVVAAIGVSCDMGFANVEVGYNLVPVDWAVDPEKCAAGEDSPDCHFKEEAALDENNTQLVDENNRPITNRRYLGFPDPDKGNTVHMSVQTKSFGGFQAMANLDVGESMFGDARLVYSRHFEKSDWGFRAEAVYEFGLRALDGGAAYSANIDGSPFVLIGPPQDTATRLYIGVTRNF